MAEVAEKNCIGLRQGMGKRFSRMRSGQKLYRACRVAQSQKLGQGFSLIMHQATHKRKCATELPLTPACSPVLKWSESS